uniref:Uncharacterized protein n=1 Tax=Coccidioides posadasii RMSCC 3488 TaxID=454284 RepID=A0A0J6I1B9_COCPO|nr:hypothetical protein CPAG_01429 [Coccidioides posadasii RMSCC 3488]
MRYLKTPRFILKISQVPNSPIPPVTLDAAHDQHSTVWDSGCKVLHTEQRSTEYYSTEANRRWDPIRRESSQKRTQAMNLRSSLWQGTRTGGSASPYLENSRALRTGYLMQNGALSPTCFPVIRRRKMTDPPKRKATEDKPFPRIPIHVVRRINMSPD